MSLRTQLKEMGYEGVTRNTFVSTVGELLHIIALGRDRHGQDIVEVKVWHCRFATPGEEFRPRDLASPIRGLVGPEGVISSWAWAALEDVSGHIAKIVSGFSACFGTLQDIKTAVGPVGEDTPIWRQLYGPSEARELIGLRHFGAYRGETTGAVTKDAALGRARAAFTAIASELGFQPASDDHALVFFRDRGELVDCIRFTTDLFQTFGQLEVFPWSRSVWRAERRLKGRYLPITSRRTEDLASLWIRPINEIGHACVDSASGWIASQLQKQQVIGSTAEFIAAIDPMYSSIRTQLASSNR